MISIMACSFVWWRDKGRDGKQCLVSLKMEREGSEKKKETEIAI